MGTQHSRSFTRKADADRFAREVEVEKPRGSWLDPRDADTALAAWAETFLSLARRLSSTTQETYRRDLTLYVLPRFGSYRLGRLPAEEIEEWLNDEIDHGLAPSLVHRHCRTLRRMLQVAVDTQKTLDVDPAEADGRHVAHLRRRESARRCRTLGGGGSN